MADHHDNSPEENPQGFANSMVGLCLVLVVGSLVAYVAMAEKIPDVSDADFALEVPPVDAKRLEAARQQKYGNPDLSKAESQIAQLHKVVKEANVAQFGQPSMKEMHDMKVLTEHHANAVITEIGIDSFMAAGRPMFDGCIEGINAVLDDVQSGKLKLDSAMNDPGEAYQKYREWCGKALPALRRFGLITPEGRWDAPEVGPTIFDIMNRFRWAAVMDLRKPPWQQLTSYEFEILTRWRAARIEETPDRRIQRIQEAAQASDEIPVYELVGNIYYQAQNYTAAQRAYQLACEARKSDLFLQRKCEFLNNKVGTSPTSTPDI